MGDSTILRESGDGKVRWGHEMRMGERVDRRVEGWWQDLGDRTGQLFN